MSSGPYLCPCENTHCAHEPARCPNRADPRLRVHWLGALCPGCYAAMPDEYCEGGPSPARPLVFSIGFSVASTLREHARAMGASEAELSAILRLVDGRGELVDVQRLSPLARDAGLPWSELFPELSR